MLKRSLLQKFKPTTEQVIVAAEVFNLGVVVLCEFIDMIDGFDDVTLDKLLILLTHAHEVGLDFANNTLESAVYL